MQTNKRSYYRLNKIILALAFIGTITSGYGQINEQQQIDSLKLVVLGEKDNEKLVHTYNEIGYHFAGENIDSTLFYVNKALQIADSLAYKKGMAECHLYNARCYGQIGKHSDAINSFEQALSLNLALKDSASILEVYRGLSYIYSYNANQFTSLDYSIKALDYADKLRDTASLSTIYNNIAAVYKKLENYESAIFYFQKSLDLNLKNASPTNIALAYSNMGSTKVEHGKLKEARPDYRNLEKLLPDVENTYLLAYFYLSFANFYTGIEKYDSAHQYLSQAAHICEQENYPMVSTRLYRRKGKFHFKQKQYKSCISSLDQCIELSNSMGIAQQFPEIYKMKAQAYSQLGNYKEAFLNSQQAHAYNDSLQNKKIAGSLAEFEKDQKEKAELARHNLEKALFSQQTKNSTMQLQFKFRLALVISILLLIAGVIAIYSFVRLRKNNVRLKQQNNVINEQKSLIEESFTKLQVSEKSLHKLNAAKDKLFSIIAHDLRSPFNAILGFSYELYESYDNYDNTQRKNMIGLISSSSESTLFLLENLLNWARSQSESIQIQKNTYTLRNIVDESIAPYLGSAEIKNITTNISVPHDIKVWCDIATIKVVLSNLFNNSIKFSNIKGTIQIGAKVKDNMTEVCICDKGIGMTKEIVRSLFSFDGKTQRPGTSSEKGTGLGLILCKEFIEANGGKIWVESEENKGTNFYFSLPISK